MKKFLLLPSLFIALSFASCTKDQIETIQDTPEKAEARLAINTVSNSFLTASWSITYILSNSNDVTTKYKDCYLSFATNGSLMCKNEISTNVVGRWVVSYVDGKTRVTFSFLNNSGFEAVNGDWTMIEGSTNSKMMMQAVSDAKNYLTLEKQ